MKKRFTAEQIINTLNRYKSGLSAKEVCREVGITAQIYLSKSLDSVFWVGFGFFH